MAMKSFEVPQPTQWWWVKRIDVYAATLLILLPLNVLMEYQDFGEHSPESRFRACVGSPYISLLLVLFSFTTPQLPLCGKYYGRFN